jgi:enterochelin esterase-like enzyme
MTATRGDDVFAMKERHTALAIRTLVGALALSACAHRGGGTGVGTFAQPEPYAVPTEAAARLPNAPAGALTPAAMYASRSYGVNFRYRIYVPAQYRKGTPATLMIFHDASSVYLGQVDTPVVLDNLIARGEMPATIALFLDPGTPTGEYVQERDRGLRSAQYDALDERYVRFLVDEIVPDVVLAHYDVVPNGWAIAGQSSGGIAAFTAAWHRPDRFSRVLTQNGSFVNIRGGSIYPTMIRTTAPKPLRVYLLSGTNDLNNQYGSWLSANDAMAEALAERRYAFRYRRGTGGHFPPRQAIADFPAALRWLFKP